MALTSPHPSHSSRPARTTDIRRAIDDTVDLQFLVRERIADLLSHPTFARLRGALDAVGDYLDEEQRLVLDRPGDLVELGLDLAALLRGRRALVHALDELRLHALDRTELARHTEALRHAFLAHADTYTARRSARPADPPIALPPHA